MRILTMAACVLAVPAAAQQSAGGPVPTVPITLSSFHFEPAVIHLKAGVPVVLVLRNDSGGRHDFFAPDFFSTAKINPASVPHLHNGKAEVPGHSDVAIALVPAPGHFSVKCTHPLHSSLGMKATIIVD